ncbi:MAG: PEP/pyruvate-binding domain-containing protein [Dorea sp.]|nr:PEP/pyruvate-binding domain-containing protein [Dorea sp.]
MVDANLAYVSTGYEGLDKKVDHVRWGENVVFRIQAKQHFLYFSNAFLKQAKQDGRTVHYIHFKQVAPLYEAQEGLQIHVVNPKVGFELFAIEMRNLIHKLGKRNLFIFDSLSCLQELWATDLMMANFVTVTAPVFTAYEDVVYYPIIYGRHSYDSISQIRENIQIFLDCLYAEPLYYVTPLKVQNRFHPEMYLTHRVDPDLSYHPMTYAASLSKYYEVQDAAGQPEQIMGSWEAFFALMRLRYSHGELSAEDGIRMSDMMMTKDPHIHGMIVKQFKPRDYLQIQSHMVGTGMIGGKACGMLLARKILRNKCPKAFSHMEPHDSYYLGSDIYYTFIIYNGYWELWLKQKENPEDRELADQMREKLLSGKFPESLKIQFKRLLDYFGSSPIIVRSSSLLEDGFGNAFAGKYESVFCVNSEVTLNERLRTFENAIRTVFASTMSPSALEYRRVRNLLEQDEQMALLVQRVSGTRFERYFLPVAAGVGYSYNNYPWNDDISVDAGVLRLVSGLGTRAVDRTPGDYPRLVSVDNPLSTTYCTAADRHKFSQHRMDLLDLEQGKLTSRPIEELYNVLLPWQRKQVFSRDFETERMFRERGHRRDVFFADCENLVKNKEFIECMSSILSTLQEEYTVPVDIEYTVNFSETGDFRICLLQCRPLQSGEHAKIELPKYSPENTFLHVEKNCMGATRKAPIDMVVYVDPYEYYTWPHARKPRVARAIGAINQRYDRKKKNIMLITPGRIGTSSPELGVPVSYAEISQFSAIMEVAYSKVGYMPELSFGSHMFQDLVEADIIYVAAMENSDTKKFSPEYLQQYPEIGKSMIKEELTNMIKVYDLAGSGTTLAFDSINRKIIIGKNE